MNAVMTPADTITTDPRWAQLVARRTDADGRFWYGVLTTGVFCRPVCASRLPKPENVRFFDAPDKAVRAGFRPCRRCRPDASAPSAGAKTADWVAELCRHIESAETEPGLEELARMAGVSTAHLQKTFKAAVGLSPHQYAAALRRERVQAALTHTGDVTGAIFDAGYQSGSRFYEKSTALLGMKPSAYAKGGKGEAITFATGASSLGRVLAAQTAKGLCAIFMGDSDAELTAALRDRFPQAELTQGDVTFSTVLSAVITAIEHPGRPSALPLDIRGTAFQQKVWDALRAIPSGQTRSYAEVAEAIGAPEAVRAVAGACAANALAVVIPCHRVVRADGSLSGYRWGVERKRTLLGREKA